MIEFLVPQPGKKKPNSREEDFQLVAMYRIRAYENGNATAFDSHITAKQVPLCASDNISQAKQWLQCCLTQHQECQRFHTSTVPNPHQRPTRVLEITPTTIRLRCNLKNEPFPYLVLSYMWGTNYSQQLRLLQSNVSAFEKAVPRDQLEASDVYKEAMRVTLALGYKYLWIDSLCIIQDSASDWAHEAQRMAVVYGNATCNLAFLFPPHAPEKPSQRSDPRIWSPCILRHAKGSAPAIYMHDDTTIEFRKEIDNYSKLRDWLVQRDWPLFHRAWTFQEYLLSPRTLLLGHGNLMWHCSHHFYDELLGAIAAPIEPPTNTNTNKTTSSAADSSPAVLFNPKRGKDRGKSRYFPTSIQAVSAAAATTNHAFSNPSILSFLTDWTNIVNEYRGRKLSFEKDRIIAFAGIATAFSHKSKLTYLGGLWAEILPAALLWHVDRKPAWLVRTENNIPDGISIADATWTAELGKDASGADALLPREIQSQLPSWSWFAVPLYKYHETRFLLSDDELFVRCKALSSPHLVHWTDLYSARLVSFTFPRHAAGQVPAGATHMHSFGGVQLRLAAATLGVRDNWAAQLAQRMAAIRRCSPENADGQMSWDPVLEYYADHVGAVSPPKNAVYALLAESQVVRCAGTKTVQRRFAGLMLVPDGQRGGSDECWTRIGVWKLRVNVLRVRVEAANIEAVAGRWGERSLIEGTWRHGVITLV
ncbi:uncharacterized protein SETTUDRAFT_136273 [Exserohilum turcica Et28A]|uniref:Heterokaryon incompatibility domain-containing protein n=1 Tax=Exserohilum turcicum (strain 28A) TaxID=671987 RepID=R0IRY2_EXST2|nr:uncharacterized protein SETTUDRAFT_136273 [Exserohilum turcica Et28A]EOA87451.1 hypothetical protein SETTUDRAFT_136273 [Exserohilum turcica Et28A]